MTLHIISIFINIVIKIYKLQSSKPKGRKLTKAYLYQSISYNLANENNYEPEDKEREKVKDNGYRTIVVLLINHCMLFWKRNVYMFLAFIMQGNLSAMNIVFQNLLWPEYFFHIFTRCRQHFCFAFQIFIPTKIFFGACCLWAKWVKILPHVLAALSIVCVFLMKYFTKHSLAEKMCL